jgi:hypothetical protein
MGSANAAPKPRYERFLVLTNLPPKAKFCHHQPTSAGQRIQAETCVKRQGDVRKHMLMRERKAASQSDRTVTIDNECRE